MNLSGKKDNTEAQRAQRNTEKKLVFMKLRDLCVCVVKIY